MNWSTPFLTGAALVHASAAAALAPCHIAHLPERVECGTIAVPEDGARPAGRRITIHFVRVPAVARSGAEPLFVFAGGPGQAARDYAPLLSTAFREVRKQRDVVLVDQRGTGRSAPLGCPLPAEAIGRGDVPAVQAGLRSCLAHYRTDPRHYHTQAALADFDAVRRVLGYQKIHLWGASYGSRTALLYARHYPHSVRSMVLDSVAPPDVRILLSSAHSEAALQRLVADCAGDQRCGRAFPSLARELETVLALPAVGSHANLSIAQLLRGALYVPAHASVLPYAIHRAAGGDTRALQGLFKATSAWSLDSMSIGQTFAVLCSEEVPFIGEQAMARDAAGSVFGDAYARSWRNWCRAWPAATPHGAMAAAVVSAAPALLLAGGLDPVTPPANARQAARTLRNSRVLVAPQAGHTVSGQGCTPRLIAAFLEHADVNAINGTCLEAIRRPPFVLADGQPGL